MPLMFGIGYRFSLLHDDFFIFLSSLLLYYFFKHFIDILLDFRALNAHKLSKKRILAVFILEFTR